MARKSKKIEQTLTATTTAPSATEFTAPVAVATTAPATPAANAQPEAKPVEQVPSPAAAPERSNIRAAKSTVEKPTKLVWTIAEEMKTKDPKVTRKAILDECLKRGIAFYTARTQYQKWAKSKGAVSSSRA